MCICSQPELWTGATSRVFTDFNVLDFYDGPATVLCKCQGCGAPKLVSVISWRPSASRIRLFGVAQLETSVNAKGQCEAILRNRAVEANKGDDYEIALKRLLHDCSPIEAVLASSDFESEIIAARRVETAAVFFQGTIDSVSDRDFAQWSRYLQIL